MTDNRTPFPRATVVPASEQPLAPAAVDREFGLMGTHMRVIVGHPVEAGAPAPEQAAEQVIALLRDYDLRLSRFKPASELCALNADPRPVVPASALLRDAVRTALEAAAATDGLVDPTVLDDLEAAGYTESWDAERRVELAAALRAVGPARTAASAHPARRWARISVDDEAGTVTRPV